MYQTDNRSTDISKIGISDMFLHSRYEVARRNITHYCNQFVFVIKDYTNLLPLTFPTENIVAGLLGNAYL